MSEPGAIYIEPDGECEMCGKVAETRPYGPGGCRICFACGQKDKAATKERMGNYLFGKKTREKAT